MKSNNYSRPAIPKGTHGILLSCVFFIPNYQRIISFCGLTSFAVLAFLFAEIWYIWALCGICGYMFQQIFSK